MKEKQKLSEIMRDDEGPALPGQPVGAGQAHQDEGEITFDNQVSSASNRARGGSERGNKGGRGHSGNQRGGNLSISQQAMNP